MDNLSVASSAITYQGSINPVVMRVKFSKEGDFASFSDMFLQGWQVDQEERIAILEVNKMDEPEQVFLAREDVQEFLRDYPQAVHLDVRVTYAYYTYVVMNGGLMFFRMFGTRIIVL